MPLSSACAGLDMLMVRSWPVILRPFLAAWQTLAAKAVAKSSGSFSPLSFILEIVRPAETHRLLREFFDQLGIVREAAEGEKIGACCSIRGLNTATKRSWRAERVEGIQGGGHPSGVSAATEGGQANFEAGPAPPVRG